MGLRNPFWWLRVQNVLLDRDLAALYGVTTKRLNEQVKRNLARFPIDFMFQLTAEEETALRSHLATSKKPAANRRCETTANASEGPPTYYTALQAHLTGWHWPPMAGSGAGDGNRTHGEGAAGTRKQAVSCERLPSVISV
jgi:hypothetical protein